VGPENLDFFRPKKVRAHPSNAPPNDVAPLKIITYCAIKTTGTLIVIICTYFLMEPGCKYSSKHDKGL
jgi:hypothetical protein